MLSATQASGKTRVARRPSVIDAPPAGYAARLEQFLRNRRSHLSSLMANTNTRLHHRTWRVEIGFAYLHMDDVPPRVFCAARRLHHVHHNEGIDRAAT